MFGTILSIVLSVSTVLLPSTPVVSAVNVQADNQTEPVRSSGDAADDMAIWVNPYNIEDSRIFGTDKKKGLDVYNLDGARLASYDTGRLNNVDVRYNFKLGQEYIDIVGATDKETDSLHFFSVSSDGLLKRLNDGNISNYVRDAYGFGFYQSKKSGKLYALVTDKWFKFSMFEVSGDNGYISLKHVQSWRTHGISEGIVGDDEYGYIYVAVERNGIFRIDVEGDYEATLVDNTFGGHLVPDIEGLTIYYGSGGKGYLIASSQGKRSYVVYDRVSNSYLGEFRIERGKIDGTVDTDGIDVLSFGLGSRYPNGIFIAQDGINMDWNGWYINNQNFKLVSWDKIANGLNLITDNNVDPRNLVDRNNER